MAENLREQYQAAVRAVNDAVGACDVAYAAEQAATRALEDARENLRRTRDAYMEEPIRAMKETVTRAVLKDTVDA